MMAEVKEEKAIAGETPVKSKREQYLARMTERFPDKKFDGEDPEERYGAFLEHDDAVQSRLSKYEESDSKLKGLFKKDPRFASYLSGVVEGGDPASGFVRHFGKDVLDMSGDEEKMAAITEANQEYLNRIAESDKLREEQEKNISESASSIVDFQNGKGMTAEEMDKFLGECYAVVESALLGRIDPRFLEIMHKGMNYENDVNDAAAAGVAEGRNQQIEDRMKKTAGDGVPIMNSGNGASGGKKAVAPKRRSFYS
jgi:hypothetical protein